MSNCRSKDNRLFASKSLTPKGRFEFDGLPAGDYYLTQQGVVEADKLAVFSLAAGEKKTIALPDTPVSQGFPRGFLQVCPSRRRACPCPAAGSG